MSRYRELFVAEALEHTRALADTLLNLERNPAEGSLVNDLFRSCHTLKGMASAMGLREMADLAHAMESYLDLVRHGVHRVSPAAIDTLLECVDALEAMVNGGTPEWRGLAERLQGLQARPGGEGGEAPSYTVTVIGGPRGLDRSKIDEVLRKAGLLGEISAAKPTPSALGPSEVVERLEFTLRGPTMGSEVRSLLQTIGGLQDITVAAGGPERAGRARAPKEVEAPRAAEALHATLKVPIRKLDELMNTVGEMVISKLRLLEISRSTAGRDLEEVATGLDRLTNDLQDLVLSIRLVPLGNVFEKFPRLVRDLARRLGREAELHIEGSEIELDRTIIAEIDEPLVHLIRNAIDHGVEPPDRRRESGKSPAGSLHLRARREQSWVYIEVEDDGGGVDPKVVRQKAVEKGLISQEEAQALDAEGSLNLIFIPGFSTSAGVTDVSGRGVGMDVVRTKVQGIGGSVMVESAPGRGTKVTLRLPLSVAIIQALLVSSQGETYALPMDSVLETQVLEASAIRSLAGTPVTTLRGEVLPLAYLGSLLSPIPSPSMTSRHVVVVEKGTRRYGLVVDSILGQQSIVTKMLDRDLKRTPGLSGATILGDGSISLILDVGSLPQGGVVK
jgi:two-component system chemotaxis sensor kinase CheA